MNLWNTPPEHLAGDSPLARAATAFLRATQELDAVSTDNGPGCETAVRRRLDAYAAAAELAEAVRDAAQERPVPASGQTGGRVVYEAGGGAIHSYERIQRHAWDDLPPVVREGYEAGYQAVLNDAFPGLRRQLNEVTAARAVSEAERDGLRKTLQAIRMGIAEPSPRSVAEDALNGRYFDPSRMAAVWNFAGAGAQPAPGSLRARVLKITEGLALAAQANGPGLVAEMQAKAAAELYEALQATEGS